MSEIVEYWASFANEQQVEVDLPEAWMFGDGSLEMGNELGQLVVQGIKTGTCAAHRIYELENERIPKVGEYAIVLNGKEKPVAIIRYTAIELIPMNEVTADFARSEGEGDLSYAYWYREHQKFFTWEFGLYQLEFTPDQLLVCQTFEVLTAN